VHQSPAAGHSRGGTGSQNKDRNHQRHNSRPGTDELWGRVPDDGKQGVDEGVDKSAGGG
jgi:hypothetical protein